MIRLHEEPDALTGVRKVLLLEDDPAFKEIMTDFLKETGGLARRPRLIVRVNALSTGLTEADLDAIMPGAPDAIISSRFSTLTGLKPASAFFFLRAA